MRRPTIPESFTGRNAVILLLAQGLAARLIVFNGVAVNGDTGLYLYDALQILWGQEMFIDFPSRSPAVHYPLAAVIHFFPDHRLAAARSLMIVVGLALGLAVYFLGREIRGERVGLVAMAIFLLTPFTITWGLWVKTEQFAAFWTVLAFIIALRVVDEERVSTLHAAAVGVLFGLALLSRRSAFVAAASLALFVLWYRHRHRSFAFTSTLKMGAITGIAGLGTLFGILFLMAGSPSMTWTFFDMYFIDLFRSSGFGAHGYLPLFGEEYVAHQYANVGPGGLFQSFCQKCSYRTAQIFLRTMLATMVALVPLLVWFRAYTQRWPFQVLRDFIPALLVAESALGVGYVILTWGLAFEQILPLALFAVIVIYVWEIDIPEWSDLWTPKLTLLFITLLAMMAAYIYRDRIVYVTYFQDFYPFIATISAVALVETWRVIGPVSRPSLSARRVRQVGAILLVLAFYTSAVGAYPYIGSDPGDKYANWYTVDRVEAYGWDMDRRLEDGEMVFAANPLYVTDSQHRLVADMSRRYYLFEGWPNTSVTRNTGDEVAALLRTDRVPVAVMTTELRTVLRAHPALNETFYDEFCEVDDPLYNTTDTRSLWVKKDDPDAPACGATIERSAGVMDQL